MKAKKIVTKPDNLLNIAFEQNIHKKKLDAIYRKNSLTSMTVNQLYLTKKMNGSTSNLSRKDYHDEYLIQRLNSPKNYADRLKDPNDFLAYPTLFFRNKQINETKLRKFRNHAKQNMNQDYDYQIKKGLIKQSKKNITQKKNTKKVRKSQKVSKNASTAIKGDRSVNSDLSHNGLTFQKICQELPHLQNFQKEDIETFADHLTSLIFKYNLNTMSDIEFLFQSVQRYLPDDYPEHFIEAVQDIFKEIVDSLNITD